MFSVRLLLFKSSQRLSAVNFSLHTIFLFPTFIPSYDFLPFSFMRVCVRTNLINTIYCSLPAAGSSNKMRLWNVINPTFQTNAKHIKEIGGSFLAELVL